MNEKQVIQKAKQAIRNIRGEHVMLDFEVAEIYGMETKRLNEQVKRNKAKFPEDFHFQLTREEFDDLKSQNATSSSWGGRRTKPYAFTEHGVLQAANVLNSDLANSISVFVIRAFVEMRGLPNCKKASENEKRSSVTSPKVKRNSDAF